jgi:hypothetical protein
VATRTQQQNSPKYITMTTRYGLVMNTGAAVMDECERLGDILNSCPLGPVGDRFQPGDKVFWFRARCDDMPGVVESVRDGKVMVKFSGRGSWSGTSKWLDPSVLRLEGEEWR